MRVYHFVNERYGLDNLRRRRLKIATIDELNDPFELFGANLKNAQVRADFRRMKSQLARTRGFLCFSRDWRNPVQWSHYADKHRGLCLGFEIDSEFLEPIAYSRKRLAVQIEHLTQFDHDVFKRYLFTKYAHWKYEAEVRAFLKLSERDKDSGLYFADFSDQIKLATVIIGANSQVTRASVTEALGELAPTVKIKTARLSFQSFRVVTQQRSDLWK